MGTSGLLGLARVFMACSAMALGAVAGAADFPSRPVTLVTGYATGGPVDVLARGVAQKLSAAWGGMAVVVENRAGANEILAAQAVARAEPDGHTILIGTDPSMSHNLFLFEKLPYDPVADLVPISRITQVNMVLVVRGDLPVSNLAEFVALMKKEGGRHNYGSSSSGSTTHLGFEALKRAMGINLVQVPYKGIAPALVAMLSGDISAMVAAYSAVAPQVQDGKVKILGVAGNARSPALPDVPTFSEAGYPNVAPGFYVGMATTRGTPPEVVSSIARTMAEIMRDKDFVQSYKDRYDYDLFAESPEDFSKFLEHDRRVSKANIAAAGVKLD